MTRDELNQSNQTNILGAGKVTKNRHWTHNENIADYVDESIESLPEDADFISEVAQSSGIQTAIINANTAAENANEAAAAIPPTQTIVQEVLGSDAIQQGIWKTLDPSTGYWAIMLDPVNRKPFAIRTNGDVELSGISFTYAYERLVNLETVLPQYSSPSVIGIGDSLTANDVYLLTLAGLLGTKYQRINFGVGGEDVNTIAARCGAVPVQFQNAFTLPSNGTTVQVFTTADNGVMNKYGKTIKPLLQGSTESVNPCWVAGIECTLSYTQTGGVGVGSYFLKRNVVSTSHTNITAGEYLILNGATKKNSFAKSIWMGQNGGYTDEDQLVDYIRDVVNYSEDSNYVVIGLHSGTAASRATLETKMVSAFGLHYFNLRRYVVNYGLEDLGLTPTTADTNAIAIGSCPPQLLIDSVHFTNAAYAMIGNAIYKHGQTIGMW